MHIFHKMIVGFAIINTAVVAGVITHTYQIQSNKSNIQKNTVKIETLPEISKYSENHYEISEDHSTENFSKEHGVGIIINNNTIITAGHVVGNIGDTLQVTTSENHIIKAHVTNIIKSKDIAYLGFEGNNSFANIKFGNHITKQNQDIYLFRYKDTSFQKGKITGINNSIDYGEQKNIISDSINISSHIGDSGSPILDKKYRLIGINIATEKNKGHMSKINIDNKK